MTTILVVDDEPAILRTLKAGLIARGYEVTTAATGRAALNILTSQIPDAVVLDLGLGDMDGVDICRAVRSWSEVPIIVLSAEDSEHRKVVALDEGADDYITKPFSMPELLARVRVALRRRGSATTDDDPVLRCGQLEIDLPHHAVAFAGAPVELTPKEFAMLTALTRHPGRVLTHRTLLHEVWGPGYDTETHYLRVYASQIRKKLGPVGAQMLVSEPGIGYRLIDPSEE
ncbi:MAG: response regulator transcription factor [Acidimicrobiia bacterium]